MYTIVVPTFNRERELGATVESLLAQKGGVPFEIIVVDNCSTDGTRQAVEALGRRSGGAVRYVFEGRQGSSAARNAGIAAARGVVIAFVDDDVLADPRWLAELAVAYRAHPDAWCIGGLVRLRLPETYPGWFDPASPLLAAYLSRLDLGDGTVRLDAPTLISANLSVRRGALSTVGLFDTELGRCGESLYDDEDEEFVARVLRVGGAVYYCGRAAVSHIVPRARMTKRWFRDRAGGEGATAGFRAHRDGDRSLRRGILREGSILVKDCAKTLAFYAAGNARRGFLYELAARKRFGYVCRVLHPTALVRRPRGRSISDVPG